MSSLFKDLIGKSYSERMGDKADVNPFNNEHLFSEFPSLGITSTRADNIPASVCFVLILNPNHTVSGESIKIDPRLEDESKRVLSTFNHVLQEAFRPHLRPENQSIGGFCAKSGPIQDYSMLVMSLSKVWEIELNCSIIPWLQKTLGIDEPENIAQIMDAMDKYDIGDELKTAYLNDREIWEERSDRLRRIRNQSAHTGVVSEDNFIAYYQNFCAFVERGWFTRLMDIKLLLSDKTC